MGDGRLHHEVHPYVEVSESEHAGCICELPRKHHLHEGISTAVCVCLECHMGRDPIFAAQLLPDTWRGIRAVSNEEDDRG